TELGKISTLVQDARQEAIPLNEKLERFSKKLILFTGLIVLTLLVIGLLEDRDVILMIKTTIALAVAAIPEGLPIVATIALARGMLKLARHQVIVKKLAAVETLGSTNIIFTDKTGTLTENRLEVNALGLPGQTIEIEWDETNKSIRFNPSDVSRADQPNLQKLLMVAVMCNNASFSENQSTGDPLEVALLKIGEYHRTGFLEEIYNIFPRLYEHPFDSETKIMGTIHEYEGKNFAAVKGAMEEVLKASGFILKDGQIHDFTQEEKKLWLDRQADFGKKGLRALGFAYREDVDYPGNFIHDLVFIGLAGFIDPPRTEVRQSIQECHNAGIRVVMVTGDHAETAKHIAFKIGLTANENEFVMQGKDLKPGGPQNNDEKQSLLKSNIFSRVSPKQKLDLVELYQKQGWIVGMTGDGVNDAPALKKADIGIAMGQRGTQVAREAAVMVLQNDSFASIVKAVRYGRVIYDNIRTFIIYLLSCNLSEILIVALAGLFNLTLPLQPMQILFLNIVTDIFPALALGMNDGRADVMKRKPRKPDEAMITRKNWISVFTYSFFITLSVFGVFLYSHLVLKMPPQVSNNIAFFSLAFSQLLHPLNLASRKVSFLVNEITRNAYLWGAVIFCTLLIMLAYFIYPLNEVLSIEKLTSSAWGLITIGSVSHLILIQVAKRMNIIA
ncbi:MAG TPA: cation-transporting P-type ATPase, partial [Cyclobacteriaceae bacterium]|nr:cation-transporting P-type ATPase [Cyclobacteriaceae bacterium]